MKRLNVCKDDVILFEGDSVTDALRDRNDLCSLAGYSKYVYEYLNCRCFNRGVGGDTSRQLLDRLENDILETNPTILSFLIGVNDTWRKFDSNLIITSIETFACVEKIIKVARRYVNQIIILEPFLLDVDYEKKKFRDDLSPRIWSIRELAQKYKTVYVPLNGIFAEECCAIEPSILSYDGVHPTEEGHKLIAREWLLRVNKLNNKGDLS